MCPGQQRELCPGRVPKCHILILFICVQILSKQFNMYDDVSQHARTAGAVGCSSFRPSEKEVYLQCVCAYLDFALVIEGLESPAPNRPNGCESTT